LESTAPSGHYTGIGCIGVNRIVGFYVTYEAGDLIILTSLMLFAFCA